MGYSEFLYSNYFFCFPFSIDYFYIYAFNLIVIYLHLQLQWRHCMRDVGLSMQFWVIQFGAVFFPRKHWDSWNTDRISNITGATVMEKPLITNRPVLF